VLHRLADLGNSVIIIEHNLDVIRNADWIIDLGPEGGEGGGKIVGEGRPAKIASTAGSYTGEFLARYYPEGGSEEAEEAEAAPEEPEAPNGSLPKTTEKATRPRKKAKKTSAKAAGPRKKKTGLP